MRNTERALIKRDTLNLRIKPEVRALIDRAAALTGKNRTDFVLDAARLAAEDALRDRTVFVLSTKAYADFLARLDTPPQPNERLRRSLRTPAPGKMNGKLSPPEPLSDHHEILEFNSGEASLDDWLRRRARANQVAGASRTYVVCKGNG